MSKFKVGDRVACIDVEDLDLLDTYSWHLRSSGSGPSYLKTTGPRPLRKNYYLHRLVAERITGRPLTTQEIVDHINKDPLDNTRGNLRVTDRSINAMNGRKHLDSTSRFKGVTFHRKTRKYNAKATYKGVCHSAGYFNTAEEASDAYNGLVTSLTNGLVREVRVGKGSK